MALPSPCLGALLALALLTGCGGDHEGRTGSDGGAARPPSILLVTLDTTRADAFGAFGGPGSTPALDALAASGLLFERAWATAPMTLPSHASMLTGLYPAGHGIHENGRVLDPALETTAVGLRDAGYRTAAFVSGLPLSARFGLDAGFDHYDDDLGDAVERSAEVTNAAVFGHLDTIEADRPLFLWVHYFDPHAPWQDHAEPGEDDATDRAGPQRGVPEYGALGPEVGRRYLSEISFMDRRLGELVDRFRATVGDDAVILVVGDHGESLGELGERTHGNLLHEAVLHVPLLLAGPRIEAGRRADPVSVRAVHATLLELAGLPTRRAGATGAADDVAPSLLSAPEPVVLAEAMQPHLQYGWAPHVAALQAATKAWLFGSPDSGVTVTAFPVDDESGSDLRSPTGTSVAVPDALRAALRAYPLPGAGDEVELSDEMRARLASLGYVTGGRAPRRTDPPRAIDRTGLFDVLDRASAAFESGDYRAALGPLEVVLREDPGNFAAVLRLAVAHSILGTGRADGYFADARRLDPTSLDLRHFEGMHRLRSGDVAAAETLLTSVLVETPRRTATLLALVEARTRLGDTAGAEDALSRLVALAPDAARWQQLGRLRMALGDTAGAIAALEESRRLDPSSFAADLDLGVLLLAARRFDEARDALDDALVSPAVRRDRHALAMALFKRAQAAVLLREPDAADRIRRAEEEADEVTAPLIRSERLFEGTSGAPR